MKQMKKKVKIGRMDKEKKKTRKEKRMREKKMEKMMGKKKSIIVQNVLERNHSTFKSILRHKACGSLLSYKVLLWASLLY